MNATVYSYLGHDRRTHVDVVCTECLAKPDVAEGFAIGSAALLQLRRELAAEGEQP